MNLLKLIIKPLSLLPGNLKSLKYRAAPVSHYKTSSGFTMIELLVGMILAVLVISPMLALVISLKDSDTKEQSKTGSQQELQMALDYIAQDLQQAVYIYDATALSTNYNSAAVTDSTKSSGIMDQIPPNSAATGCDNTSYYCIPVLAFWKRKYLDRTDTVTDSCTTCTAIGSGAVGTVAIGSIPDTSFGSDRFLYSLVVYYLIKDKTTSVQWSSKARIGRFEISDGIVDANSSTATNNRQRTINSNTVNFFVLPDKGFALFNTDTSSGSLSQRMNTWTKFSGESYTNSVNILVDYIDDTVLTSLPTNLPQPPANDLTNSLTPANANAYSTVCSDSGTSTGFGGTGTGSSRVPPDSIIPTAWNSGSFYACVNPINSIGQSVALIYLRGNSLARLNNSTLPNNSNLSYFPILSVRVAVRGLLQSQ